MLIVLEPLTSGTVSSTGTVRCSANNLGSVIITTDGTNQVTVVCRDNDASGTILVSVATKSAGQVLGPFHAPSGQVYYSCTGTGGAIQMHQYVNKGF